MLLEEFEPVKAVIEPHNINNDEILEVCDTIIMPFSGSLVERLVAMPHTRYGGAKSNINGKLPWYIYEKDGYKVAFVLALLGAPALVGSLEELKESGFKNFILFGSCGVLDEALAVDKLIVPTAGLRDDGTSYHYAPASDEIACSPTHIKRFSQLLDKQGVDYTLTKTWTTDAFYRETPAKVKRRKEAGSKVVDMEWTAVEAWRQYRQANVYHFFYTADYVDHHNEVWDNRLDKRQLDNMTFFDIAFELAKELDDAKNL